MARYKPYSCDRTKLIPVSYDRQILPNTFEHTLSEVINRRHPAPFNEGIWMRVLSGQAQQKSMADLQVSRHLPGFTMDRALLQARPTLRVLPLVTGMKEDL